MDEVVMYLKALVYLYARALSDEEPKVKPEVLLTRAGLSYKEIANILGKKEMAVAKAIQRAKNSSKKGNTDE